MLPVRMLFYGIVTLATAMLNARRRFLAAAFAPVLNNLVVIVVFLALPHIADGSLNVQHVVDDTKLILLMGVGTTAGVIVMAIALLPAMARARVHLRFLPQWRHPAVITMVRLSGWTVGYVIANQIALFVITVLANGTSGGPFIYVSAYAFFQLPHGLFAVSLMTTFTPEMASAATRNDLASMRAQLSSGLRLIALVIVPASALYIALGRPIIVLTLVVLGALLLLVLRQRASTNHVALSSTPKPVTTTGIASMNILMLMIVTRTPNGCVTPRPRRRVMSKATLAP